MDRLALLVEVIASFCEGVAGCQDKGVPVLWGSKSVYCRPIQ